MRQYLSHQRIVDFYARMEKHGISFKDATAFRKAERVLHKWAIADCNGDHWRDDETGKPFRLYNYTTKVFIPDLERAALRRVAALAANYPKFVVYHQPDPRGCALYLIKKSDVPKGKSLDAIYHNGISCGI
jgi:Fe-S cluster assembly scaffold protein SufB